MTAPEQALQVPTPLTNVRDRLANESRMGERVLERATDTLGGIGDSGSLSFRESGGDLPFPGGIRNERLIWKL